MSCTVAAHSSQNLRKSRAAAKYAAIVHRLAELKVPRRTKSRTATLWMSIYSGQHFPSFSSHPCVTSHYHHD